MNPFTNRTSQSVAALGEERLITAIRRWLGDASPRTPIGIGDDCAVLAPSRRKQLLTVDPVIFGRHFDDAVPPQRVGEKLLKRNLSDIAAMGGRPVAAVVALTLDSRVRLDWLEKFYRGLAECARAYRVTIVGGDVAQASGALAANLTLLGEASGPRVLARQGAKNGDAIYVTGVLGGSLRSGHHFRFTPRLAEGRWLARRRAVRAMLDLSDGLAKDLPALAPRGTRPVIESALLPLRAGADIRAALTDGEDYELVFAVARDTDHAVFSRAWRRAFPRTRLTRIGYFTTAKNFPVNALNLDDYRGYEHLR